MVVISWRMLCVTWPTCPGNKASLLTADALQLQQVCIIFLPQRTGGPQPCDQLVTLCGLHPRERSVAVVGQGPRWH